MDKQFSEDQYKIGVKKSIGDVISGLRRSAAVGSENRRYCTLKSANNSGAVSHRRHKLWK
jgi:hypothetical protein